MTLSEEHDLLFWVDKARETGWEFSRDANLVICFPPSRVIEALGLKPKVKIGHCGSYREAAAFAVGFNEALTLARMGGKLTADASAALSPKTGERDE